MRKIVFGPVRSRRLGNSLGVDLTPHKTCNLDCVYCECGKTTKLTCKREDYYKVDDVLKEISQAVETRGPIDFITFSGSGEPSLYKDINKVIEGIRKAHPGIKIAVLTNALLLTDRDVFDAFLMADLVLPSVDSVMENGFKKINRPHPDINLKEALESLIRFRKAFKGGLWAEVFICPGVNDSDQELGELAKYLKELSPDKVQINALDRPGAESWVQPLGQEGLKKVLEFFNGLPVEVISRKLLSSSMNAGSFDAVFETLKRRPLTANDIKEMSGHSEEQVASWIEKHIRSGHIKKDKSGGAVFYKLA